MTGRVGVTLVVTDTLACGVSSLFGNLHHRVVTEILDGVHRFTGLAVARIRTVALGERVRRITGRHYTRQLSGLKWKFRIF